MLANRPSHDAPRAEALDAARGLCAVLVVLYHGLLTFQLSGLGETHRLPLDPSQPWLLLQHLLLGLANGPGYVTFFFVLSGTVLALSLERDSPRHPAGLLGYLIKRGFRLYPLLVVAAAMAALLQLHYFTQRDFAQATAWFNDSFKIAAADLPAEFLANAQGRSATLNGPAWSIKVEILASAVFPLLYLMTLTARRALLAGLLLVAAMFLAPGGTEQWHYMNVFLACFFAGALLPRWGGSLAEALGRMRPWSRRALLGFLLLMFLFARRLLAPEVFAPPLVVLLETLGAVTGVVLLLHGQDRPLFHSAPMRLLARLSYGLYLLHVIVLSVIGHAVLPFLPAQLGPAQAIGLGLLLSLATLAATLPLAWLLHTVVERPMQQIGRVLAARLSGGGRLKRAPRVA